jgi:hypothetical protein
LKIGVANNRPDTSGWIIQNMNTNPEPTVSVANGVQFINV